MPGPTGPRAADLGAVRGVEVGKHHPSTEGGHPESPPRLGLGYRQAPGAGYASLATDWDRRRDSAPDVSAGVGVKHLAVVGHAAVLELRRPVPLEPQQLDQQVDRLGSGIIRSSRAAAGELLTPANRLVVRVAALAREIG